MSLSAGDSGPLQLEGMNDMGKDSIGERLVGKRKAAKPKKEQPETHNMLPDTGASVIRPKLRNFYRPEQRYSGRKI